jgi:hypothetical protein
VQIAEQPGHAKALSVRASCFTKKKLYSQVRAGYDLTDPRALLSCVLLLPVMLQAVDDYTAIISAAPDDKQVCIHCSVMFLFFF